ncbi:hypothetical protein [Demequina sp. NBRC 110057]|uniref:hypothetical protein n=1 Tax=Demequina sp. NBRC 110057 TaxID=1570346 RepID=UPI000A051421|nr:hypothetical protein [Demequina sp. NBRC 110057]
MRFSIPAAVGMIAAATLLTACSSDADTDASASASASPSAAESFDASLVSSTLDSVRTATGCETWAGGRVAGAGVVAGWEYTCDVDGDTVPESTLAIYTDADSLAEDIANRESADSTTAILEGDNYLLMTTDADHASAVEEAGAEVVRPLS